jgi:hypothetical protein
MPANITGPNNSRKRRNNRRYGGMRWVRPKPVVLCPDPPRARTLYLRLVYCYILVRENQHSAKEEEDRQVDYYFLDHPPFLLAHLYRNFRFRVEEDIIPIERRRLSLFLLPLLGLHFTRIQTKRVKKQKILEET